MKKEKAGNSAQIETQKARLEKFSSLAYLCLYAN
jgi:hypothetical protein